ncbi:MAG: IS66 family transposase [Bacillota bacterium]|nr:IS66 family transposase [Bacillota bacterium]
MTRAELEQLSRDALIDLVLRQQAVIEELQALVNRLQRELAAAQARMAELEARLGRPPKTPDNSSVPPSKAFKRNRPQPDQPRKRGPKVGHVGVTRPRAEPDVTLELRVERCRRCGQSLDAAAQQPKEWRQVVDLPPIRPVVYEAIAYEATCPHCGEKQQAAFPPGFPAPQALGPSLRAAITYLYALQHLPYQRLQSILAGLFGLKVAVGSLVNAVHRIGAALAPQAEEIRQAVVQSAVVSSDETGARIDGQNWWHWVFRSEAAVYHVIARRRGAQVIEETLDGAQPEVWVSDQWRPQLKAPASQHQLCLAHELRRLKFAEDCGDTVFAPRMAQLLRRALQLARNRVAWSEAEVQRRKAEIEQELDGLLQLSPMHPEGERLQETYRRQRDKLLVFLERPEVPPTNNASERALRPAVVHRKVTGGFRSEVGARVYSVILSVTDTARQRGLDVLEILRVAAGSRLFPGATAVSPERSPP